VEGWIEFEDKKIARKVAESLNCTKMMCAKRKRKSGFYSEDLWNIRYLPKFRWEHLTEKLAYDARLKKEKM